MRKVIKSYSGRSKITKKKSLQGNSLLYNPSHVLGMLHNSFCKYDALIGIRDPSDLRLYLFTLEKANFTINFPNRYPVKELHFTTC